MNSDTRTLIEINGRQTKITLGPNSDLTELSFGIETAITNFFGRGICKFDIYRSKTEDGSAIIELNALSPIGPMVMSKVASYQSMIQEGLYPQILTTDFKQDGITEGQNKYIGKIKGQTKTVIETDGPDPKSSIGVTAYGLSDLFTGFFNLGINYMKWQGSVKGVQIYIRHDLTEREVQSYLKSRVDYPLRKAVKELD